MVGKSKLDRRGSGPLWFLALAIILYGIFSLTVAAVTADDCNGLDKEWQIFPPEWECTPNRSIG